jgi:DNA-3-methyladenine glycosylase II
MQTFNEKNFKRICGILTKRDRHLAAIIKKYGCPPLWSRQPGFNTLVRIILEQQVSLQSARAAYDKLLDYTGGISPDGLLRLTDEEMRACYFSRQKTIYVKALAEAIVNKRLDLDKLETVHDDHVREELIKIKGIGNWTVDIYLLMALRRCDIFPVGDLAMVSSFIKVKSLSNNTPREKIIRLAESWKPYRSVATMILWHSYIKERKILVE